MQRSYSRVLQTPQHSYFGEIGPSYGCSKQEKVPPAEQSAGGARFTRGLGRSPGGLGSDGDKGDGDDGHWDWDYDWDYESKELAGNPGACFR